MKSFRITKCQNVKIIKNIKILFYILKFIIKFKIIVKSF